MATSTTSAARLIDIAPAVARVARETNRSFTRYFENGTSTLSKIKIDNSTNLKYIIDASNKTKGQPDRIIKSPLAVFQIIKYFTSGRLPELNRDRPYGCNDFFFIFCYNHQMGIEERLKNETLFDLKRLARQLKATGYSKLNKQALIEHIKANYNEQEIKAIIDVKLTWWGKIKKPLLIWIGVLGGIASIIGVFLFFSDKCDIAKEKRTNEYYENLQERQELRMRGHPIDYINGLGENPILKHHLKKGQELSKESLFEQAIKEFKECLYYPKATKSEKVAAHILIGNCYYSLSMITKAKSHYIEALNLSGKVNDKDERLRGKSAALGNIGLIYSDLGKPDEALKYHQDALAIDRKIGYEQGIASDLGNIGLIYSSLGKPDEALKYLKESLDIFKRIRAIQQVEIVSRAIESIEKMKK